MILLDNLVIAGIAAAIIKYSLNGSKEDYFKRPITVAVTSGIYRVLSYYFIFKINLEELIQKKIISRKINIYRNG